MGKKVIKHFILIFTLIIQQNSFGQKERTLISGVLYNSASKPIKSAHIFNLTTKKGTISNIDGSFNIAIKTGDWIEISNIQFFTKKIKIKQGVIKEKKLTVYLLELSNILDEAVIKKKLKGTLIIDKVENVKDTIPKVDKEYYDFSKMDFTSLDKSIKQAKKMKEKQSAIYKTDPTKKNAGTTIASIGIPNNSAKKKKALRAKLNFKESFPEKLKLLLGEDFFFIKLKIPKENYYHFLSYCEVFNIEGLFKNNKHFELLKILLNESKSYLLLIEKNK